MAFSRGITRTNFRLPKTTSSTKQVTSAVSDQEKTNQFNIDRVNRLKKSTKAEDKETLKLLQMGNDNTDQGKILLAGAQGSEFGGSIFGEGSLGRISEGFSDAQSLAMRTKAEKEANNAARQAQRQMSIAQAKSGMGGGAAAFQAAELQNERAANLASVNRDIFLAQEQQRKQDIAFNLEQAAREKAGRLGSTLGFMQMQQGLLTADKAASAIMNAPMGGGKPGGLLSGIFGSIGL